MSNLILYNANIISMDPHYPEATLIAIENGRIAAITNDNALKKYHNKSIRIIDCEGKTVLPGFIDAHCHFKAFAESFLVIDLSTASNILCIPDIQHQIAGHAKTLPCGAWIKAKGYHDFDLKEKRHPNCHDLDKAAPDHPVIITHRTGHAHVLNSMAMEITGLSLNTPDPPGGLIDREISSGKPTGLLYEMGSWLSNKVPGYDEHELEKGVIKANDRLLQAGITTVHEASSKNSFKTWKQFKSWMDKNLINSRIYMMLSADHLKELQTGDLSFSDKEQLCLRGIKIILDETSGRLHPLQNDLNNLVKTIDQTGNQAIIHAIEENAIESACNAIANAVRQNPEPHLHRIEHCSVCPPALRKKIAALGITVVTQPGFLFYNGDRYLATVAKHKLPHLYPVNSFLAENIPVAAGSDCPVIPPAPLNGIQAAVCRKSASGASIFSEERISAADAFRMYTLNAARAMGIDNHAGSITPGKWADLVILSDDPLKVPANSISRLEVEMTIINGVVVWEK